MSSLLKRGQTILRTAIAYFKKIENKCAERIGIQVGHRGKEKDWPGREFQKKAEMLAHQVRDTRRKLEVS